MRIPPSRSTPAWAITLLLTAAAIAATAHATVFARKDGEDPRYSDMRELLPLLDAIGYIESGYPGSEKDAAGTAFLIGKCYALTNSHVSNGDKAAGKERDVILYFGYKKNCPNDYVSVPKSAPGSDFCFSTKADIIKEGEYNPALPRQDVSNDWSILRTHKNLGHEIDPLVISKEAPRDIARTGEKLISAGYPGDKRKEGLGKLWGDRGGCYLLPSSLFNDPTLGRPGGGYPTDCSINHGNSGGPIVRRNRKSGKVEVIAMSQGQVGHFENENGIKEIIEDKIVPTELRILSPNVAIAVNEIASAEIMQSIARDFPCSSSD